MGRYVDGFVIPVPKKNRAAYIRMARLGRKVWLDHGALEYHECVADDVMPGKVTSFPQSVKLKKDEEVWFAWAVYKSRRHRDRPSSPRQSPTCQPGVRRHAQDEQDPRVRSSEILP